MISKHTCKIIAQSTVPLRTHFTTNSLQICYRDILSVPVVLSSVMQFLLFDLKKDITNQSDSSESFSSFPLLQL